MAKKKTKTTDPMLNPTGTAAKKLTMEKPQEKTPVMEETPMVESPIAPMTEEMPTMPTPMTETEKDKTEVKAKAMIAESPKMEETPMTDKEAMATGMMVKEIKEKVILENIPTLNSVYSVRDYLVTKPEPYKAFEELLGRGYIDSVLNRAVRIEMKRLGKKT